MSTPDPATTKWVPLAGGGGSSIAYENAWQAGVAYEAGAVVVYNGVEYMAVNPSTGVTPSSAISIASAVISPLMLDAKGDLIAASANDTPARLPVGTDGQALVADAAQALGVKWGIPAAPIIAMGLSLPVSPAPGEEYILVDSGTAPTYAWRFRYLSSISDAYKWVYVGGSPLFNEVTTQQNITNAAYVALATAGPIVTLPRAGIYEIAIGARILAPNGLTGAYYSYDIGATGAVDADAVAALSNDTAQPRHEASHSRVRVKTFATAVTLTAKYKASAVAYWADRFMSVRPVRVS